MPGYPETRFPIHTNPGEVGRLRLESSESELARLRLVVVMANTMYFDEFPKLRRKIINHHAVQLALVKCGRCICRVGRVVSGSFLCAAGGFLCDWTLLSHSIEVGWLAGIKYRKKGDIYYCHILEYSCVTFFGSLYIFIHTFLWY